MDNGEYGGSVVSAPRPVEEALSISPGAATLLLQLMGGNTAGGNILSSAPATTTNVS